MEKVQGHKTTYRTEDRRHVIALPNAVSQLGCFTVYLLGRKRITMILNVNIIL